MIMRFAFYFTGVTARELGAGHLFDRTDQLTFGSTAEVRLAQKFKLGQLLATPGVLEAAEREDLVEYLSRHARGDWGVVDRADWQANDRALVEGMRLFSAYLLKDGTKIWIITEADRGATTILLPDEY